MRQAGSLAKLHGTLVQEGHRRNLQILRRWALTDSARVVVVGTVARAEVATKVARIWLRDAAKVRAHADDDQPLWLLADLRIRLGVAHASHNGIVLLAAGNHLWRAATDEDWLA